MIQQNANGLPFAIGGTGIQTSSGGSATTAQKEEWLKNIINPADGLGNYSEYYMSCTWFEYGPPANSINYYVVYGQDSTVVDETIANTEIGSAQCDFFYTYALKFSQNVTDEVCQITIFDSMSLPRHTLSQPVLQFEELIIFDLKSNDFLDYMITTLELFILLNTCYAKNQVHYRPEPLELPACGSCLEPTPTISLYEEQNFRYGS